MSFVRSLDIFTATIRQAGLGPRVQRMRDLIDLWMRRRRVLPLSVTYEGHRLRGFLRHRSFMSTISTAAYESHTRDLFLEALTEDAVVLDIGAHIGMYTHLAAANTGPKAELHAIEPDAWNCEALRANLARNGFADRVRVHNVAISDREGNLTFYVSPGTIGNSLVQRPGMDVTPVVVRATSVDVLLRNTPLEGRRLVMKVDVEGAELAAFAGMTASIARAGSVVILAETNPSALRAAGASTEMEVASLRALGLDVQEVDEQNHTLRDVGDGSRLGKGMIVARKTA